MNSDQIDTAFRLLDLDMVMHTVPFAPLLCCTDFVFSWICWHYSQDGQVSQPEWMAWVARDHRHEIVEQLVDDFRNKTWTLS